MPWVIGAYLRLVVLAVLVSGPLWAQAPSSVDCRVTAYLPPLATFGGPATVTPGNTELGLAFGAYGDILPSPCIHAGAEDWFLRFRRGLSDRFDLGFDLAADNRADGTQAGTAKVAVRYRVTDGFRLEGGLGAADGGDGRNVNGDVAAVIGTHNPNKAWNYYMSLRLGAARGCVNCGQDINHAPGALVPLGAMGTTARVSGNVRFVMEAGLGEIFARQYSAPAGYVHLSFGILFDIGQGH
jgi:hypothetical protein